MIAVHRSVIFSWALIVSTWPARAAIKQWRPLGTDWQDPNSWDGGRVPCSGSTVVLPEEATVSLFVSGTVSWRELVMPRTGELVLDGVSVVQAPAASCGVAEATLANWQPGSWFDPQRWTDASLAVPHSERIPCAHDAVRLPDRRALAVDFNRVRSITVGQLSYGDKALSADEWRRRIAEWRYQVLNPPGELLVNGTECQEPLGCRCGHAVDVMQMVCSNAGTLCSNQLECEDAFRPPGHCCDACGAMMKLTVDERIFTKAALDRLVSSLVGREPGVQSYSYRTGASVLHVTVADGTSNEASRRAAGAIRDYLVKDGAGAKLYGVVALELLLSGPSRPAGRPLTPEELRLVASNLATTLVTFLLVGLAGAAFYRYRRQRNQPREDFTVSFARFRNDTGNVEIGVDTSTGSTPDAAPSGQSDARSPYAPAPDIPAPTAKTPTTWKKLTRAFANPLFNDPSASRMSARWSMSSLMKSVATHENPIFDVHAAPAASAHVGSGVETLESAAPSPVAASDPAAEDDATSDPAPRADENASGAADAADAATPTEQTADGGGKLKRLWNKLAPHPADDPFGRRRDDRAPLTREADE